MLGNSVFQSRPVKDIIKEKISAIDYFDRYLYYGDMFGAVHRLELNTENDIDLMTPQSQEIVERVSKSKIDVIKCIASLNLLLIQTEGTLFIYSPKLVKVKEPLVQKTCAVFALNEYSKCIGDLVVVNRKKEGLIFKYDIKTAKFFQLNNTFNVPEVPVSLAWLDRGIFVAYNKKEYGIINSENFAVQTLSIPVGPNPYIKVTDNDEVLLITNNNVGIYVGLDGQIKQKSTLSLSQKAVLSMTTLGSYLLILFENLIQVFNVIDSKLLQEISFTSNSTGKCLSSSSNKVFYVTTSEILYLYLTPFEIQIQKCLLQCKVDDAFSIFNQHVTGVDPERPRKLEQLRADAVWALMKDMQFKVAKGHLMEINFDPREILILFPEYISTSKKLLDNQKKYLTMSLVLYDSLSEKISGANKKEDVNRELQKGLKQAKDFLMEVLEFRRSSLITSYPNLKEVLSFVTSTQNFNQARFPNAQVLELLEVIDFALIKMYADMALTDRLKAFFTNNKIYCREMLNELDASMIPFKVSNGAIYAKFCENFGKTKECLETWKQLSRSQDEKLSNEACEETVRFLKDITDKKLIFETLKWLLPKNQAIGCKAFQFISEELITPDAMLSFISEFENAGLIGVLKEKYLEILVNEKKTDDERFHTSLALYYLEILFKHKPKDNEISGPITDPKVASYQKKFSEFLKNPNSKYRPNTILEKIKDSWLIHDEIYLYGKEKQHKKALKKLVKEKEFNYAEQYCAEKSENLLTELFLIYIDIFTDIVKALKDNPTDQKKQTFYDFMKKLINDFLKKYATHSELDPTVVLEKIPEDWILEEKGNFDGLYAFLSSITSHTLNQKRNMKCAKHISEMDLVNVEYSLTKAKKANIKITTEKNCSVCHRRIGDKVFVIYPNGVVAHHTCISNKAQSICPVTGQNFEKNYKD